MAAFCVTRSTVFRSKVARRIFALFVLAALVPIATVASLIYLQKNAEGAKIVSEQLHRETKSAALIFSYLLDEIEIKLRHLAQAPPASRAAIFEQIRGDRLESYRVVDGATPRADESWVPGSMTPALRRHLDGDKAALLVAGQSASARLHMAIALRDPPPGDRLLLVTVNPEALRSISYDSQSALCVLTEEGDPILCDASFPGTALDELDSTGTNVSFKEASWSADGHDWKSGSWRLYTAPRFLLPSLTVLWAGTENALVTRPSLFIEVFPPVIVLAMLLVTLVSIGLIRRLLTPVDRLREAATELARGNFGSRVLLSSGDEFEDLAESFNGMARDLEHQFTMLGTLAELDRMVLSAQGKKEIIDVLIERMPEISACDAVSILELADRKLASVHWRFREPASQEPPPDFGTEIHDAAFATLQQCGDCVRIRDPAGFEFARAYFEAGMRLVVCLPVICQSELTAVICLAYRAADTATEAVLSQARSLADRAAVALSNAAWEEKLYHQAHYDALTGLPNRQLFNARLDEVLTHAQRHDSCVALLFVDVDRFKTLNDSLGHHAGDQYLVLAARRMLDCIAEDCMLARLGGDEFTVIVPDLPTPEAALEVTQDIAERLRKCLTQPIAVNDQRVALSASIGVAIYPTDAGERIELMRCADQAMYHSKELGRNGWSYYSAEINASALERLELAAELEGALARGEFQIYLQPQLRCDTDELTGAEVLLRWAHPRLGMVPPSKFIPVAEQTGLLVPIGAWVLEQAGLQLQRWHARGIDTLTLAVNISAVQLRHPEHVDLLCRTIRKYSPHAHLLELEMTESTCVDNLHTATGIFSRLKDSGVTISIDDFGTGYSSMSYLRHFSVDTIKIDQTFVRDLPEDEFSKSFVVAIIAMAHSLGCTVVAEGVETEAQLDYLRGLGCEKAQGYHIARPLPTADFDRFARSWRRPRDASLHAISG